MKKIGAFEAKTHLSSLLDRVSKGESFTLTRRGEDIAILSPAREVDQGSIDRAIERIRSLSKKAKLGRVSLRSLIEEGRR